MEKKEIVIKICGEYPENFVEVDILSNPNFIFENDPNYETVKLFDYDKNTVFVNSFLECQHYVNGGWDFTPEQRNENFYLDSLFYFSIFALTIGFMTLKKFLVKT